MLYCSTYTVTEPSVSLLVPGLSDFYRAFIDVVAIVINNNINISHYTIHLIAHKNIHLVL